MTKTVLFAIFPGKARSSSGGHLRHVSGRRLIKLYGLDPEECVVHTMNDRTRGWLANLIPLGPLATGAYSDRLFVSLVQWLEGTYGEGVGVS